MNNKGFTLVELLAVIIILSLLALLASTAVTNLVKDSKQELYDTQIELIKSAAEVWGADNLNMLPEDGSCKYLTLKELKGYGLLDSSVINPKTSEEFSNDLKIKITAVFNDYGTINYTYEVGPKDVSSCEYIYPTICTAVTDATKTTGNVPIGLYKNGDEYICEVKPGTSYHFFVVSTNENKVNLILNNNVYYNSDTDTGLTNSTNAGEVAWQVSTNNVDGPVTAIEYLYNATKDWTNVPPLNYIYNDKELQGEDNGYTSFVSTNGKLIITSATVPTVETMLGTTTQPLRTRLPIYLSDETKTEVASKTDTTTYLYTNLDGTAGKKGYWTLSSYASAEGLAYVLHSGGSLYGEGVSNSSAAGVRPVISIPKYNIS